MKTLSKMKTLVQKSKLVPNNNQGVKANQISKFQKVALKATQAKAVKGGASDTIIIEEMLNG